MLVKKIAALLFSISLLATLNGCGTTAKFVYPDDNGKLIRFTDGPAYAKKIVVTPFEEMRGSKNQTGTYFLYLIPLMPYGWGEYERPDAARMFNTIQEFNFTPSEDLAKAAAYSLRRSNLFEDAFFSFGGDKEKAQWILEGEILSTEYRGSIWSYCLSAYGPVLWILGLPAGRSHNDLSLALRVKDVQTKDLLWEKTYSVTSVVTQGLYYSFGYDVKGYSVLMQDIMNDAIADMNREFQEKGIK